jgi:hypothetical protein
MQLVLQNLAKFGKLWQTMAKFGKLWQTMAKYGKIFSIFSISQILTVSFIF